MYRFIGLTCIIIFVGYSCNSNKKLVNDSEVASSIPMKADNSNLVLNFSIHKGTIRDTFNQIVDSYLETDLEFTALGMDINLEKHQNAEISISYDSVVTILPISILASRSTFLKKLSASGILNLEFHTQYHLDSSWHLSTQTVLAQHAWIQKPKLSLGGLGISIAGLANTIINRYKSTLEAQIDKSVNEQLTVRPHVLSTLKYLENPVKVDTIFNSWLHIISNRISLNHFSEDNYYLKGRLKVDAETLLLDDNTIDHIPGVKLPVFSLDENIPKLSQLNLVTRFSLDVINDWLVENYKDQNFTAQGKQFTIKDVELSESNRELTVLLDVAGSINGKLRISGFPQFDNTNQTLSVQDLKIDFATKNVFHKAASWLAKGKIKNELEQMLHVPVKNIVASIEGKIDEQIKSYTKDLNADLEVEIINASVHSFVIESEKIATGMTVEFLLSATIKDLKIFTGEYFKLN